MNDDDHNPGKYDHLCTYVRIQTNASAAVVIIMGGDKGNGFSVQAHDAVFAHRALPDLLERMAKDIRAAHAEGTE
jgi:hypothetical protein